MIRIAIDRASDGTIRSFTMKGHARFDGYGRDIVCAGASAVTFGTLNALESLLGVVPETKSDEGEGFLQAVFADNVSADRQRDVQLLLESMLVMLQSIEQSYGKYIRIQDPNGKGGN